MLILLVLRLDTLPNDTYSERRNKLMGLDRDGGSAGAGGLSN